MNMHACIHQSIHGCPCMKHGYSKSYGISISDKYLIPTLVKSFSDTCPILLLSILKKKKEKKMVAWCMRFLPLQGLGRVGCMQPNPLMWRGSFCMTSRLQWSNIIIVSRLTLSLFFFSIVQKFKNIGYFSNTLGYFINTFKIEKGIFFFCWVLTFSWSMVKVGIYNVNMWIEI